MMIKPTNTTKYRNVLRPLLAEEKAALRASLIADGLLSDLVMDQNGDLLEGHHRYDLCTELGIELRFRQVTTSDPVNWIKGFQKARRNLNRKEMRRLIVEQVKDNPAQSDRQIANSVGVSPTTVGAIRSELIADGKVDDVQRLDTKGRINVGGERRVQTGHVDEDKPSPKPEKAKPAKKAVAPVSLTNGRFSGLSENIMYHFADDGQFHRMSAICKALDPEMKLRLTPSQLMPTLRNMGNRKDIHIDTKPAAKGQKLYRFYWQEKTIGLSVLKAKFGPVIEDLKKQAELPISHQSSGRFIAAAQMLIVLLRELEAE